MSKALYAGSFDPFTVGHMSILERGLPLFEKIYVGVGVNINKPGAAEAAATRVAAIKAAVAKYGEKVEVLSYNGLTTDVARELGAGFLLRGVRNTSDFLYEYQIADINRQISGVETVFLPALPEHASLSSSVVRELKSYGTDVSRFLP